MLLLVGGASRAGKSLIITRLLREMQIPYFRLDFLMMALVNGAPDFGVDPDASGIERGELLWPLVRALCVNILETEFETAGNRYSLEGDFLLPKHVYELAQAHPGQVRACFLGYAEIAPERKRAQIRNFRGAANDWLQDASEEYVLELVHDMIGFSRYLWEECVRLGLPYFDTSEDFVQTIDRAVDYLKA